MFMNQIGRIATDELQMSQANQSPKERERNGTENEFEKVKMVKIHTMIECTIQIDRVLTRDREY